MVAVAQLVDSRIGLTPDDEAMVDYLNQVGIPYFIIATKVDKLNATQRRENIDAIVSHPVIAEGTAIVPYSALKNEGRDEVLGLIAKATGLSFRK